MSLNWFLIGTEVLMVVSDGTGECEEKPLIAYEVAQEAMLAYAQAQSQANQEGSIANVEIHFPQESKRFVIKFY